MKNDVNDIIATPTFISFLKGPSFFFFHCKKESEDIDFESYKTKNICKRKPAEKKKLNANLIQHRFILQIIEK